jgi:hypothetical protein
MLSLCIALLCTGWSAVFSSSAGATTYNNIYYVNSANDHASTYATDCTLPSNTDCGIDDAVNAYNNDSVASNSDQILFSASIDTFYSVGKSIANSSGTTLSILGSGAASTSVSGNNQYVVFQIDNAGAISITGVTIKNGVNGDEAGGVNVDSDTIVTINSSTITNNSGQYGGGVNAAGFGKPLTINSSIISNNTAQYGAGVLNNQSSGVLIINSSTITNNTSRGYGGGVNNWGKTTIQSSIITGNIAPSSGGGGIGNNAAVDSNHYVHIAGSIISNSDSTGGDCGGYAVSDFGYNIDSDGTCGLLSEQGSISHSLTVNSSQSSYFATASPVTYTGESSHFPNAFGIAPIQANSYYQSTFTVASNSYSYPGYSFAGWSDGLNTYQPGSTFYMGPARVILAAQWTQNPSVSITYANGGGSGSLPTQSDQSSGLRITVASSILSKPGYVFAGWSDGSVTYQPGSTYTVGSSAVTLTAVWGNPPTVYSKPTAPSSVTASLSSGTATVSFNPGSSGNLPTYNQIDMYINGQPVGNVCNVTGATSCPISNLGPNATFTFTVTAVNSKGSATSAVSNAVSYASPTTVPPTTTTTTTTVPAVKRTITCVKGKISKKITAVSPVCPAGYKKK